METYPVTISELRGGKGRIVGAIFRQSLINLGYSPDAHVYDIINDYFRYEVGSASNRFVRKVKDFYDSLDDFRRRIFLCEFLERGRHYPFWWLEFTTKKEYLNKLRDMKRRLNKAF